MVFSKTSFCFETWLCPRSSLVLLTWAWPRNQSSGKVMFLEYNSWEVSRIEQCSNWRDNIKVTTQYYVHMTSHQPCNITNIPHEQKERLDLYVHMTSHQPCNITNIPHEQKEQLELYVHMTSHQPCNITNIPHEQKEQLDLYVHMTSHQLCNITNIPHEQKERLELYVHMTSHQPWNILMRRQVSKRDKGKRREEGRKRDFWNCTCSCLRFKEEIKTKDLGKDLIFSGLGGGLREPNPSLYNVRWMIFTRVLYKMKDLTDLVGSPYIWVSKTVEKIVLVGECSCSRAAKFSQIVDGSFDVVGR